MTNRDFVRIAIVGTGQTAVTAAERAGSAADPLVDRVPGLERERQLLLRAGGLAILQRAAHMPAAFTARVAPAEPESRPVVSARLSELLATWLASPVSAPSSPLLFEALERMARAGLRLPEELLPRALAVSAAELRERLRPVLGQRGAWLAAQEPAWAWAVDLLAGRAELPNDFDTRWEEGSAAEQRALLAVAFQVAPERARQLLVGGWKGAKAEVRLSWLTLLERALQPNDARLLASAELGADRSANVRLALNRLQWRFPDSAVAQRMRQRAHGLLAAKQGSLQVTLPPQTFDANWEADGVVEAPPATVGRRQWWLTQLLAAVSPAHWAEHLGLAPEKLAILARQHEFGDALIDGLVAGALRFETGPFFAPLWDVTADQPGQLAAGLVWGARDELAKRMTEEEAEPRMLHLLDSESSRDLLAFPRPWPKAVSRRFLVGLRSFRAAHAPLLEAAGFALDPSLLPEALTAPDIPETDTAARAYQRAFEQFQSTVQSRRIVLQET